MLHQLAIADRRQVTRRGRHRRRARTGSPPRSGSPRPAAQVLVLEAADAPGRRRPHRGADAARASGTTRSPPSIPRRAASPVFARMPLADHGLEWVHPEACYAHPLPDGEAEAALPRPRSAPPRASAASDGGELGRSSPSRSWTTSTRCAPRCCPASRRSAARCKLLASAGPLRLLDFTRLLPGLGRRPRQAAVRGRRLARVALRRRHARRHAARRRRLRDRRVLPEPARPRGRLAEPARRRRAADRRARRPTSRASAARSAPARASTEIAERRRARDRRRRARDERFAAHDRDRRRDARARCCA